MAAEDEGRTEEASAYKLEKARKEGRVAKSQEISGALVLLFCVLVLIFLGKWIFTQCANIFRFYFSKCSVYDITDNNLYSAFFVNILKLVLPVALASVVAGILGNIIQTRGFIFSWKLIEPKFSNILPHFGEYFKKILFSVRGVFNILKSFLKVFLIVIVAFLFIRKDIFVLLQVISNGDIMGAIAKIAMMCAKILLVVSILFLIISIPDYFVQRHEFRESMKMTKQEVKEEFKELEGDPEVKGRLQQAQRQLLMQNMPKAVAESDVVITNPTHYAVALKYDREVADSPTVTAKGEDNLAFRIREIAKENNIPIVENRPVARGLYTETEVGDIIPESYYRLVAVIYSQILNKD